MIASIVGFFIVANHRIPKGAINPIDPMIGVSNGFVVGFLIAATWSLCLIWKW